VSCNFQRQAVQKGPIFVFRISPDSFLMHFFLVTLSGSGNNKLY